MDGFSLPSDEQGTALTCPNFNAQFCGCSPLPLDCLMRHFRCLCPSAMSRQTGLLCVFVGVCSVRRSSFLMFALPDGLFLLDLASLYRSVRLSASCFYALLHPVAGCLRARLEHSDSKACFFRLSRLRRSDSFGWPSFSCSLLVVSQHFPPKTFSFSSYDGVLYHDDAPPGLFGSGTGFPSLGFVLDDLFKACGQTWPTNFPRVDFPHLRFW